MTACLLSASPAHATVSFDLNFDDPGASNSAYYAGITACFNAAAAEWATHFSSDADLQVVIGFSDPDPTANGSSGTTSFVGFDGTTPVYEQGAAAKIRTGVDANGPDPDIQIEINPDYLANNLWFDPDPASRTAPIPPDRTDAVSVFLHELTHAFAFNGWRDNFNGTLPDFESTFDQLETFDGTNFYFNGPLATAYYGGPVPLTYGNINHFGNAAPGPGSDLIPDLMNGVVFQFSTRYDISTLDLLAIADTGLPVTNVPVQWNGGTGNWSDASQWSTHAIVPNANVPNATFAATIPSGTVTLDINVSVDSLTLASGAILDLTDNKLIVQNPANRAITLATLQNQIATHAITSSTMPANFGLALLDNAITKFTTFGGFPVDPNSLLLSEELLGDTNADGSVDLTDLSTILNNFGATTSAWTSGNFDNTPTIDLTDLSDVLNNFGLTNPNASLAGAIAAASPAPEPSSLLVLGLCGALLIRRQLAARGSQLSQLVTGRRNLQGWRIWSQLSFCSLLIAVIICFSYAL